MASKKGSKAAGATQPPYSCRIMVNKSIVRVKVTLTRTAPKFITFEPTSTHFHLDTLRDAGHKYLLQFPYPQGIKVDASNVEADFKDGICSCDLPITDWGEATPLREEYERKQQEAKEGKAKATEDETAEETSENRKRKRTGTERDENGQVKKKEKKRKKLVEDKSLGLAILDQVAGAVEEKYKRIQKDTDKRVDKIETVTKKKTEKAQRRKKIKELARQRARQTLKAQKRAAKEKEAEDKRPD